jgi:hypothetical protein
MLAAICAIWLALCVRALRSWGLRLPTGSGVTVSSFMCDGTLSAGEVP